MNLSHGTGNPKATYLVVGDHYTYMDQMKSKPFSDGGGTILYGMLQEAGILTSDCWFTNLLNAVPPQGNLDNWFPVKKRDQLPSHINMLGRVVHPDVAKGLSVLQATINLVKPKAIITLGNPPLWALTSNWSSLNWRGSMLKDMYTSIPLVPVVHPRFIMAQWQHRVTAIMDMKRAVQMANDLVKPPEHSFIIRPSLETVMSIINRFIQKMDAGESWTFDVDIETLGGHIRSLAFAWSLTEAICIPFGMNGMFKHYWPYTEEEGMVVHALYRLMTHPKANVRMQNGLFDVQYIFKHWHFIPRVSQDTMISHHTMWTGLPKNLAYQASMYSRWYVYWKDMRGDDVSLKEGE